MQNLNEIAIKTWIIKNIFQKILKFQLFVIYLQIYSMPMAVKKPFMALFESREEGIYLNWEGVC